jgi:hypothetical protein
MQAHGLTSFLLLLDRQDAEAVLGGVHDLQLSDGQGVVKLADEVAEGRWGQD